jgi:hypothetical protein
MNEIHGRTAPIIMKRGRIGFDDWHFHAFESRAQD